ncbi:MAG: V0D/AC39 family V-type ATPase subunit [Gemmatimonadales bacterium]
MTAWGDLVARARGLSGHLLRRAQLLPLCAARSVSDLAAQLSALGLVPTPVAGVSGDEHALELALRRRAGARLRILANWAGSRREQLAPVFDDEDRRALRALLRGAIAGVAPESRLAGLVPTPSLPIRALEQLAGAGDIATIAALLVTWRHPFGPALAAEVQRKRPDLLQMEMTLLRTFATRAHDAARTSDAAMCLFVERIIDLENLRAALVIAEHPTDIEPVAVFVAGGRIVRVDDLELAASARNRADVVARLAPRIARTPLAAALVADGRPADDGVLDELVAEFRRLAIREPLGTAPVILFVLGQRAELHALVRILWSVSLGVPRSAIERAVGLAA